MNLVIDVGNTQTKLAIFDARGKLVFKKVVKKLSLELLKKMCSQHGINASIFSSVAASDKTIITFLKKHQHFILFTHKTTVPLKNRYLTPATLGRDRLANAVGAACLFPRKNCLVIDAGTCIKFDFVNAGNEYLGGAISPGIQMRYRSLHTFTAQLPLIKPQPHVKLTGNTTASAIVSGVQNGALSEIEHVILQYKTQYKQLKIVVTGGDLGLFANRIKSHIFAAPDLTLMGLNQILENNK